MGHGILWYLPISVGSFLEILRPVPTVLCANPWEVSKVILKLMLDGSLLSDRAYLKVIQVPIGCSTGNKIPDHNFFYIGPIFML